LCVEFATEGVLVDVVDEGPLALDLDHRQELAVAALELWIAPDVHLDELELQLAAKPAQRPARPLAEMAALGVVEDDLRQLGVYG
jgi:hypothetical protein